MKRFTQITIIFALFALTGCTFDTDIDADVYDNGTVQGEDRCDGISALLESEEDPEVRDELTAAYDRCVDRNPEPPSDEEPPADENPDDPDQCEDVRETADGEVVEGECRPEENPDEDPNDPVDVDCAELLDRLNSDDPDDPNATREWDAICTDQDAYTAEECEELVRQCTEDGDTQRPGDEDTSDLCAEAYDYIAEEGIDVESLSSDEIFERCLDSGLEEQLCEEVAYQCFDNHDGTGDPDGTNDTDTTTCEDIEQYLVDQGYDLPLTEDEAEVLYHECLNSMQDQNADGSSDVCDQLRQCVQA